MTKIYNPTSIYSMFKNRLYPNRCPISLILATDSAQGIGKEGKIPWHCMEDMKHFKQFTSSVLHKPLGSHFNDVLLSEIRNVVLMGRKTWESIGSHPLDGRINVIISREINRQWMHEMGNGKLTNRFDMFDKYGYLVYGSIEEFLLELEKSPKQQLSRPVWQLEEMGTRKGIYTEHIFVIGGSMLYNWFLEHPQIVHNIFWTMIFSDSRDRFDCDVYVPLMKQLQLGKGLPITKDLFNNDELQKRMVMFKNVKNTELMKSSSKNENENGGNSEIVYYQFSVYINENTRDTFSERRYCSDIVGESLQITGLNQSSKEEYQYHELIRKILEKGEKRQTRNGLTYSLFGERMEFDIRDRFPLCTSKRVFLKGIAEELFWFLKGDTNVQNLKDKNVHIWDGNTTREYLDSIGLNDYEENDAGPIYGFQWRHFGAEYEGFNADYTGKGVDQLGNIIDSLRNNPHNRRMLMSGWNPLHAHKMCLPPCHTLYQFYLNENKELSLQMYQRSCDVFLGGFFNIASCSLLVYMIADMLSVKPGRLIWIIGDAHIYDNHVEQCEQLLQRTPRYFPKLIVKNHRNNIEDYCWEDFKVVGYNPHPTIKANMNV